MLWRIYLFELRYQLRQPLFWLVALLFGLMTYGAVSSDAVTIGGSIGNVHRNAPFVILQLLLVMSVIGIFALTAFVASAAVRDFELGTSELFFTRPIAKHQYLLGRFGGSLSAAFLVFLGPCLGIWIGSLMPWLEPERLGPTVLGHYLFGLLVFVFPNLLFAGALFFVLAALSRSMLATYLGVVAFFALYLIAATLGGDVENLGRAALLDPFGGAAFGQATRYWTVLERNASLPPLAGGLLANRLIWAGVGLGVMALGVALFRADRQGLAGWRKSRAKKVAEATPSHPLTVVRVPAARRDFSRRAAWTQFVASTRLELISVLKGVPFLVILAFGVMNFVGSASFIDNRYGTQVWPVTHLMLEALEGSYLFLLAIILTFYAGEIVFRERTLKMAPVFDALPTPGWVPLASKLTALLSVVVVFVAVGGLAGMVFQTVRGYRHLEPELYLQGLGMASVQFLLAAVLAFFFQVITDRKFVGFLAMVLFMVSSTILKAMHFEHNLYDYASAPNAPYSDMNGYGHFVIPWAWFNLYWSFAALALVVASALFWVRGSGHSWANRWSIARQRFTAPWRGLAALAVLGFVATGSWIFYNTNLVNEYLPSDELQDQQADYEKRFAQYRDFPQPRIVDVAANVDIFPRERRMKATVRYRLANRETEPIAELHISAVPRVKVLRIDLPEHTVVSTDPTQGYSILHLTKPLAPGETLDFTFEVEAENPGFVNGGSDTNLVANGTFFNNVQYFPSIGYDPSRRIFDRNERKKRGLAPVERMPKIDHLAARRNTYVGSDSDWIRFEATVSTDSDQIALAPGYLEKEWQEGGRRYFHYKMDAPILHFYSFLSARWQVRRDRWNDVAIEVYYQPGHDTNVDRMVDGVKKSLDYFTQNFSPYQYRQVRILEFPRYAEFAQAFPNTIPFSESIGFIADLRDPSAIDFPFYVTAHEVAHQWWAHQVIGAFAQGATMLSETFAQYSALMVMEKEYGREKMRKFLKYELDRYLQGRGGELLEELPLALNENQQYIHYNKGSLAMVALRDAIGEEKVNAALARLIEEKGFKGPPFPVSRDAIALFREVAGPEHQGLIDDLFERITLFDNRVEEAKVSPTADGKYKVELAVSAKKVYADGGGAESETPMDQWVEVGVFAKKAGARDKFDETVLFLEKKRLTSGKASFEILVDAEPSEVGIDPYNKLIDRNSDDNRKRVERAGG